MSVPAPHRSPLPFVSIPGGCVRMMDGRDRRSWLVTLAPFEIAAVPVTIDVWNDLDGGDPRAGRPVTGVSWFDAVRWCNRASVAAGLTPCYSGLDSIDDRGDGDDDDVTCDFATNGYRLPTEAEWEYACRAGDNGVRYGALDAIAWHQGNADDVVHLVGQKQPNAFGLYDTIGNVWEWCWDVYDPAVYRRYRVFRGGGFADGADACRASCRRKSHPTWRVDDLGFRIARTL